MKAYKILALLERVEKMKAGDKRVLINGFPCKVDYRIIADDLFEDAVSAIKDLIHAQEQVKNCSIPAVVGRSEQCCSPSKGFYLGTTCPKCNRPFRSVKTE